MAADIFAQPFVIGRAQSPVGPTPQVAAALSATDLWEHALVRLGVGRMDYAITPGLYCVGQPGPDAPVLVTANYKYSFDLLRKELPGQDAWILALDTNGINVWCAAGKRSFGTAGLSAAIGRCRLAEIVSHRRVILPQLAAPGVAAHQVRRATGFAVTYGPVRAADLPAFLAADCRATPAMRRVGFDLGQRLILAPMELFPALKLALPAAALLLLLELFAGPGALADRLAAGAWRPAVALLAVVPVAAVLGPALLPWLPGRAFALKGAVLGLASAAALLPWLAPAHGHAAWAAGLGCLLLQTAVASLVLMNFTGASTYTSLSGVKKEMRLAVPLQIAGAVLGVGLHFAAGLLG